MSDNKKPLDFFTGKMSHVNHKDDSAYQINIDEIFDLKDLPSCVYRAAFKLKNNPYMSSQVFFKDLSLLESMQLYNMAMLFVALQTGNFVVDSPQKQHQSLLTRVTLQKCVSVLTYGNGEESIENDQIVRRTMNLLGMTFAHFMELTGNGKARYDRFNIDAPDNTEFFERSSDDPPTTEGQPNA